MTDPSLLTNITSWFTPTTLFIFINLVIGTIAVTSRFTSPKKPQNNQHDQLFPNDFPPLARAPSLLERVKSINFSLYKFPNPNSEEQDPHFLQPTEPVDNTYPSDPNPPQLARAPSLLERVKSINFSSVYRSQQPHSDTEAEVIHNSESEVSYDPNPGSNPDHKPKRSKSETKKSKQKAQENIKKSASEKSMKVEREDDAIETLERRRPQTARLDRTVTIGDGDQGVDAKADDFINKFRRQLKLQRLDSLLRYKQMLSGN